MLEEEAAAEGNGSEHVMDLMPAPIARKQGAFNCGLYAIWMGIEALTQEVNENFLASLEESAIGSTRICRGVW